MSRVSQFLLGLQFLPKGFGFLARHPSLWIWVLIPWLLGILILALSWGFFVHIYPGFYQFFLAHVGLQELVRSEGFWATLAFAGLWVLKQILKILIFLLGLILLSLLSFLVTLILAAPLLDLLAEKVGTLAQGLIPLPFAWGRFIKNVGKTMVVEGQKAALFLICPIPLLLLNFIPAVGGFLYTILTCLFGMWALGFVSIDYPMGHQLFDFKRRFQFARTFKYSLFGFGLPFLIPFAPLLLQALMVVGGTLLYHRLNESSVDLSLSRKQH